MNFKLIISVLLFYIFKPDLFCQKNSVEIYNDLKKLNFLGSIIYIAAHPDDENTALLSYFSNEKLAATGYLSLTRGSGGQNLIGDNLKEKLGVIRTEELYAARKIDGAQQFFSSAKDFGFSKIYQIFFLILSIFLHHQVFPIQKLQSFSKVHWCEVHSFLHPSLNGQKWF